MSDLSMTRGDDATFDIEDVGDLSGSLAATFTAKRAFRDADVDAVLRKDLEGGVAVDEDGASITIDADDTADLAVPLILLWDLEVVEADGLTTTVATGTLRIGADVTRESSFVPGSGS